MDLKKISITLGIILALGTIIGSGIKYDKSVAKAEDMKQIQQSIEKLNTRLDKSDLEQMGRDIQRRMWLIEDQYGFEEAQKLYEYKCLRRDLETTDKRIEELKED